MVNNLMEADIPGAPLGDHNSEAFKFKELKFWLGCRKDQTVSDYKVANPCCCSLLLVFCCTGCSHPCSVVVQYTCFHVVDYVGYTAAIILIITF